MLKGVAESSHPPHVTQQTTTSSSLLPTTYPRNCSDSANLTNTIYLIKSARHFIRLFRSAYTLKNWPSLNIFQLRKSSALPRFLPINKYFTFHKINSRTDSHTHPSCISCRDVLFATAVQMQYGQPIYKVIPARHSEIYSFSIHGIVSHLQ